MYIYKGLEFKLESWLNGDKSWLGEIFEVINFDFPYMLVKRKVIDQYNSIHIFNIYDQRYNFFDYDEEINFEPKCIGLTQGDDLKFGDVIILGSYPMMHFFIKSDDESIYLRNLHISTSYDLVKDINNCSLTNKRHIHHYFKKISSSFIFDYYNSNNEMECYYQLFGDSPENKKLGFNVDGKRYVIWPNKQNAGNEPVVGITCDNKMNKLKDIIKTVIQDSLPSNTKIDISVDINIKVS